MNHDRPLLRRATAVAATAGVVALAALMLAPAAHARSNVYWSVGVNAPGVGVGVTNAYPVYSAPAPVYVQPQPVYVAPRPIYAAPPVYYAPPPVVVRPPVVLRPPIVVAPAPVYPIGWGAYGGYRHHRHWRGGGWRY